MISINNAYSTILVNQQREAVFIQLNRVEQNNSINAKMIYELSSILESVEKNPEIKIVVLKGNENVFCTGMDFEAMTYQEEDLMQPDQYYDLLITMSKSSKVIISEVEGKVNAGGMGFIAASDIVIANPSAIFGLSEALFGLLPVCVMPFLIQRIGPQKSKWLTLTTQGISAKRAFEIGLVDEITEKTHNQLRKNILRISKLDTNTIHDVKSYTTKLWSIKEETRSLAINKLQSLVESDIVKKNITNFIKKGEFPWEK